MTTEKHNGDIEYLQGYLKENPDSMLFARLADAYLNHDRVDEAVQLCEEGIRKHPYYATGHFVLGKGYMAKKLYEQAEKEFKRVLLFDPKYLAAHKMYGDLMKEIGWENTCEMSYKKILQIDPLDDVARSIVGEYVIEAGDEEEDINLDIPEQKMPEPPAQPEEQELPPQADLESVSPMPVSPEEEDLLFREPEDKSEVETEDVIKSQAPPPPDVDEDAEIDEAKAEEFSYILDDIFKDEVVEEGKGRTSGAGSINREGSSETPSLQDDADQFLADLQMSDDEPGQTQEQDFSDLEQPGETKPDEDEDEPANDTFDDSDFGDFGMPEAPPEPKPEKSAPPPAPAKSSSGKNRDKGDKIVTPTLGEIYAAQGQYSKAIDVFETLIKKHPDNDFYHEKIAMLKQKLAEQRDESQN